MSKNEREVVKSNELITAKYSMTTRQEKLFLYFVSKINNYENIIEEIEIDVEDFISFSNNSNKVFKDEARAVREDVKELMKKFLEVNVGTEEKPVWLTMSCFDYIEYDVQKRKIRAGFGQKITPYLYSLSKEFTKYDIKNISNFKCGYSFRIYELAKQYQKIGNHTIEVDYIREYLMLENKYSSYNMFKVKVLDTALEEINKNTDVKVTYKELKESRKVAQIKLKIKENKKNIDKMSELENLDSNELVDILAMEINRKYNTICRKMWKQKIAKVIDKKAIIEAVEEIKADQFKKCDIKDVIAYFEGILKNKHEEQTGVRLKATDMMEKVDI